MYKINVTVIRVYNAYVHYHWCESLTVELLTVESLTVELLTVESLTVESLTVESLTIESLTVESLTVESLTVKLLTVVSQAVMRVGLSRPPYTTEVILKVEVGLLGCKHRKSVLSVVWLTIPNTLHGNYSSSTTE